LKDSAGEGVVEWTRRRRLVDGGRQTERNTDTVRQKEKNR